MTKERLRLQRKEGAGKGETTWEQHHCTGLSDLGEFAVEELQSMHVVVLLSSLTCRGRHADMSRSLLC